MKTYKVKTSWTGYSEYTVKADSKEEAEELCMCGSSDTEQHTLSGLDYGGDEEQVTETKIIEDSDNEDNINPTYYRKGIEVTDFIMEYELDFCSGNVIKYLVRQGKKNPNGLEDLNKAKWYLTRLIKQMENNNG